MKFVVLFEDNPAVADNVRREHMPQHLAFLERNAGQVQAAGPLRTANGAGAGGLWLVNADSVAEVDAMVKKDPFWPAGLRKSVRVLIWQTVFENGRRL